jgi:hypothetical protein
MTENEKMFPDYSRPASVLGFNIPIAIPIKRESGRETYAVITARVEFDGNGEQQVTISENSRNIIKRLGEDKVFKYIVGISRATHNVAAKMSRKRWFKISEKAD